MKKKYVGTVYEMVGGGQKRTYNNKQSLDRDIALFKNNNVPFSKFKKVKLYKY